MAYFTAVDARGVCNGERSRVRGRRASAAHQDVLDVQVADRLHEDQSVREDFVGAPAAVDSRRIDLAADVVCEVGLAAVCPCLRPLIEDSRRAAATVDRACIRDEVGFVAGTSCDARYPSASRRAGVRIGARR